jgi:PAS domain S-box-containing protein
MDIHDSVIFDFAKKKPEELIELLKAYQKAIDVNIISSVTDQAGKILYANDKFCEVSKYSNDELVGQNHRIVNSGYHPKEFFAEMWRTIESGKAWHGEIRNQAKDASIYWVDTVILPISYPSGQLQYLSLRTLITEKKAAEEQNREYTRKLNEMLHMTSHRVRAPLTRCLGLIDLVNENNMLTAEEIHNVLHHLKSSALELDDFTQELTTIMRDLEQRYDQDPVKSPTEN